MKKFLIFGAFFVSTAVYAESEVDVAYVNWSDNYLISELQCLGHNGGHHIGTFSPNRFTIQNALKSAKNNDKDQGCKKRNYTNLKTAAKPLFDDAIEKFSGLGSCEDVKYLDVKLRDLFERFMSVDTLAVVTSSMSDDEINVESCSYYDFYIYRKSGTAIKFTLNYTD